MEFQMNECLVVLREYSSLIDAYLLDFFTENHMNKLPESWREFVKDLLPEYLGTWIDLDRRKETIKAGPVVLPLSLQCLRRVVKLYSLPRTVATQDNLSHTKQRESSLLKHPRCRHLFTKHVKPKKRYEIVRVVEHTVALASQLKVNYIVDVGSGLGHLSRMLAYGYGFHVCCWERQSSLSEDARLLDLKFEKIVEKYGGEIDMTFVRAHRPTHMHCTLAYHTNPGEFVEILKKAFSITDENFTFGIIGLHACGDLAVILAKLFLNCPEAKFVNMISCCYHKLTSSDSANPQDTVLGFPLSQALKRSEVELSYESRALASHALEVYCDRLCSKEYENLKIHCYRAALETIVKKNWPQWRRHGLCNVKHVPRLTFLQYCVKALQKVNISVVESDVETPEITNYLDSWRDVVMFYTLRLMLAPLVETVMLLDRTLYLMENGAECKLSAIFDPRISSRNQILTAIKDRREDVS